MQYKNVLVYLDQGASNEERVRTAIAMAEKFGAKLTGVVVNALPTASTMLQLSLAQGDKWKEKAREEAEAVTQDFSETAAKQNVECDTCIMECMEGRAPVKLSRFARNYDISIMRQANPKRPDAGFISDLSEEVLFASGRPVFFMPYIGAHTIPCRRGLIAWDGSAAATRAVHDALPLLEQMETVELVVVDANDVVHNMNTEPGEGLSAHLTAHGIKNRVARIPSGGLSTSTVILNKVSDSGADILIMGGYGTAKLRELVLGGVTRTLFNCMTVPVVMSH
ncbi:MAG: universal stress protein [Gammaproteobacteria bacterium]|nr:universal stress protein [Gammaproteobacteria bacterium]MDH3467704.1 universal stress protein [Gammaproteobacteria bacterium]